jgi:hypothetical protein
MIRLRKRFAAALASPDSQVAGGLQWLAADSAYNGGAVAADERDFHFLCTVGAIQSWGILRFGPGLIRCLGHIGREL